MSDIGKTLLKGHSLKFEGRRRYERDGTTESRDGSGCGRCSCGALSEMDLSTASVKRWHREHKDSLRTAEDS